MTEIQYEALEQRIQSVLATAMMERLSYSDAAGRVTDMIWRVYPEGLVVVAV